MVEIMFITSRMINYVIRSIIYQNGTDSSDRIVCYLSSFCTHTSRMGIKAFCTPPISSQLSMRNRFARRIGSLIVRREEGNNSTDLSVAEQTWTNCSSSSCSSWVWPKFTGRGSFFRETRNQGSPKVWMGFGISDKSQRERSTWD